MLDPCIQQQAATSAPAPVGHVPGVSPQDTVCRETTTCMNSAVHCNTSLHTCPWLKDTHIWEPQTKQTSLRTSAISHANAPHWTVIVILTIHLGQHNRGIWHGAHHVTAVVLPLRTATPEWFVLDSCRPDMLFRLWDMRNAQSVDADVSCVECH